MSLETHRAQQAESEARVVELEAEVERLSRSTEAQRVERDGLLAEIEALRAERDSLQVEVAARDEKLGELHATYDEMVGDLERRLAAGEIELDRVRRGLRMTLPNQVLFAPGSADLLPAGRRALVDVAERLAALGHRVEVMGHTDDRPIEGTLARRYPTNWELAGARAASVVRALQEFGVDPTLLAAISYGPYRPLVSNETAEGRSLNRRIEIRLHPEGAPSEPPTPPDSNAPAVDEGA